MSEKKVKNRLKEILEIEKKLNGIKDVDVLLESLLTYARHICNADAGSIYEYDSNKNQLKILFGQNDTQQAKLQEGEKLPYSSFEFMATTSSISGYCALFNKVINIDDVYNMPRTLEDGSERPYNFNSSSDVATNYHTKSMLTIPLQTPGGKVLGVLQIINAQDEEGNVIPFQENQQLDVLRFASDASHALDTAYMTKYMVHRMAKMAAFRDPKETAEHVERVAKFSVEIYDRYASNKNIPFEQRAKFRDTLSLAAKCHDFGKVGIADLILKKPGAFTEHERAVMKSHTCLGAQLFPETNDDLDVMAREICLRHHEHWDGGERAYPGIVDWEDCQIGEELECGKHLKGEEIPLSARIVALADVFDALSHQRVYKEAWSLENTFNEIERQRGRQFDPDIVDAFLQIKERIIKINSVL